MASLTPAWHRNSLLLRRMLSSKSRELSDHALIRSTCCGVWNQSRFPFSVTLLNSGRGFSESYKLASVKKKGVTFCNSENGRQSSASIRSSPFQDSRIAIRPDSTSIQITHTPNHSQDENLPTDPGLEADGDTDTIAAIITPLSQTQGSVSIIRLSGKSAPSIALKLFKSLNPKKQKMIEDKTFEFQSHRVEYGLVYDLDGNLLDEALLIPMLSPHSYTKEDVIEIQCHGGLISVQRILNSCLQAGARLAKQGEFTLRAFLNGRLDLNQAESISNLISSKTIQAHDAAIAGLQGGLSSVVKGLNERCIRLLSELEARIDFDDELPPLNENELIDEINAMSDEVAETLKSYERGKYLQSGLQIAILGKPNVGKSSLLNSWSKSEKAIVTDIAGTTRDIVESHISIDGYPALLLDTAGIHSTQDLVESIGVARSEQAGKSADVILFVISADEGWTSDEDEIVNRIFGDFSPYSDRNDDADDEKFLLNPPAILVVNKMDLNGKISTEFLPDRVGSIFRCHVHTCAITGRGIDELEDAILKLIGADKILPQGKKWTVNKRQAEQLMRAKEGLFRVGQSVKNELPIDFWCIDLRGVAMALGQITGDGVSEQVLNQIFSKFCIGK